MGGGPAGDLYLLITVLPHARFERSGDDLTVEVPGAVSRRRSSGAKSRWQPSRDACCSRSRPLTQNGRRIRLGGKGMPVLGQRDRRGDLFARVSVLLPEQLSERERALFEELRQDTTTARAAS